MKKKLKPLRILRHIIQIVLFLLLPGLYILAFGEIKGLYISVINGSFSILSSLQGITELLILTVMTMLFGRFFCGWACAFGTYNDFLHIIAKNIFHIKFKLNPKADSVLKYMKYVILAFLVLIIWTSGSTVLSGASPWDAFASLTDFKTLFSSFAVGFVLLVLITIGALFVERFFCRYLCPLGAIFSIASVLSIFKIKMSKKDCGSCNACSSVCSMGIDLKKKDMVRGGECISCMKCAEVCPRKNTNTNIAGLDIDAKLASSFAVAACIGIYSIGQLGANNLANISDSTGSITPIGAFATVNAVQKYVDGTYTGTGTGFRGSTTTVSVTIHNDVITDITTVSYGDDAQFYKKAESSIFSDVINEQSANVDTVSGATFSSQGLISAIEDALAKAEIR